MLGMMSITAFFSMFMSNTATTAMMLSILVPVLACFEEGDRSRSALALSIPIAANIGGMGTPIGTMPNAVALRYLAETKALRFSEWLLFGLPIVCILLLIAWFAMLLLFPPRMEHVSLQIEGRFRKGIDAILVYLVFVVTLLLWLTDTWHGMSTAVVALLPVVAFSATGIIGKEDLKKISWDVLWLATGGLALGLALERTGIVGKIAESIPFAQFSPLAILILFTTLAAIMANFMSHTATANLLLPIVTALGASLSSFAAYGGAKIIILAVTLACSLGMSYPISTPPNALAHATGLFETRDMTRIGLIVLAAGMLVVYAVLAFLQWSRLL
jgi:sodium-dependent dicarboxylate transporter 2/3/5